MALRGDGARKRQRYAGVVEQHVDPGFLCFERVRGCLYDGEVIKDERDEGERACCSSVLAGCGGLDLLDGGKCFWLRATCYIDLAAGAMEDGGKLEADTGITAYHDEDFAGLGWEVGLC